MIRNYLTIAFRNLRKRPFYNSINIFGLALGMTCTIFITIFVIHELSYDRFHQDSERLFRVTTNGGQNYRMATTPAPLAEVIRQNIPEIETVARIFTWNHSTMRLPNDPEKVFRETSIYIADTTFLDVMDFNMIAGSSRALDNPSGLVLTKASAERYFGTDALADDKVLGREIQFGGSRTSRVVTGVVDPPSATHFPFDMLVATTGYGFVTEGENWGWNNLYTYLKLKPGVVENPDQMNGLQNKLDQIVESYVRPSFSTKGMYETGASHSYELQALTDIHIHSNLAREHQANGSITTLVTLGSAGVLILLLACINFINLATAQASRRAKEVGVRKVLGSSRKHLVFQHLIESMIVVMVALVVALGSVELLRAPFNQLSGKELTFNWWKYPALMLSLVGGVVLTGLISGSYPAFYLSAFRPVTVLKGNTTPSVQSGKLRNVLIVFQFVVTISLIVMTSLVIKQLRFIQAKDVGYERENVLVIKNDKEIQESWKEFKIELAKLSSVKQVSFATSIPTLPLSTVRDIRTEDESFADGMYWFRIDPDYLATLGLEMVAGRGFVESRAADQRGVLLNESALDVMGLEDPIGKFIIKNKGAEDEERLEILGIVKDFHTESFDRQVKPMAIQYFTPSYLSDYIAVRFYQGGVTQGVAQVEETWSQFEPDNPFVYSFLDQDFDRLFRAEVRLGSVLSVFTAVAIAVACLGLLGMIAFVASQRTKEVGIRKVLGASVGQITMLLSKDYLRLVVIAFVIASPISYWAAVRWLDGFVYRVKIDPWLFVLAGLAALLITWITVSYQSIRAAAANPVDSLRNE